MGDVRVAAEAVAGLEPEDPTGAIPTRGRDGSRTVMSSRAEEIHAALKEYGRAVMRLVQREDLVARARAEIAAAEADVAEAAAVLARVGVPVPKRTGRRSAAGTGARGGGGSISSQVIAALAGGDELDCSQIADRSGIPVDKVRGSCPHLVKSGRIRRVAPGVYAALEGGGSDG